ncbi:MAG: hypothetical protein MI784_14345 [Cytophagales bacterium]|nr:hypothetical protein [Cytophagales bacterium]
MKIEKWIVNWVDKNPDKDKKGDGGGGAQNLPEPDPVLEEEMLEEEMLG